MYLNLKITEDVPVQVVNSIAKIGCILHHLNNLQIFMWVRCIAFSQLKQWPEYFLVSCLIACCKKTTVLLFFF